MEVGYSPKVSTFTSIPSACLTIANGGLAHVHKRTDKKNGLRVNHRLIDFATLLDSPPGLNHSPLLQAERGLWIGDLKLASLSVYSQPIPVSLVPLAELRKGTLSPLPRNEEKVPSLSRC